MSETRPGPLVFSPLQARKLFGRFSRRRRLSALCLVDLLNLATACRVFLENHPALRADLEGPAFTHVPADPAVEARAFADWWLDWPLSQWMDGRTGRRWFVRRDNRLPCPP